MIEIQIKSDGKKILDKFCKKDITLNEVGIVLHTLKRIEQELIDLEFDEDILIEE